MIKAISCKNHSFFGFIIILFHFYRMELKGDINGSQGAESYFLAKIVTMSDDENLFYDVEMSSSLNGKLTLGNNYIYKKI